MPGLVPGIHVLDCVATKTWMAGASLAMTSERPGMHDIKWIREHKEEFDHGLARRGLPSEADKLLAIDERRRAAIQKAEAALARRNVASREIGAAKKSNEEAAAQALMAEVARLKAEIPALEAEEKKLSKALDDALAQIPNVPLPVRDEAMFGTAQLPKFVDDQFFATRTITRTELLHDALKYAVEADQEEFRLGKIDLETLIDRTVE